jgi:hypothetical protein
MCRRSVRHRHELRSDRDTACGHEDGVVEDGVVALSALLYADHHGDSGALEHRLAKLRQCSPQEAGLLID